MRIATTIRPSEKEQDHGYWLSRKARGYNAQRKSRAVIIPEFVGVDSEGVTGKNGHRAVLLGVGSAQYENTNGLHWSEVFQFFYGQFTDKPKAAYVGFYLGYDFNQWFRTLPEKTAWELLTPDGKASRKPQYKTSRLAVPVRVQGWEVDMLGFKRLQIRPSVCECERVNTHVKCEHKQYSWAYLCDAGAFFQMSFMKVIDPNQWTVNGELTDWPCTEPIEGYAGDDLYNKVLEGKARRAVADLDDDMRLYNRMENILLSRVMKTQAIGFNEIDIHLQRDQWYGPGAAAAYWLRSRGAPKRNKLEAKVPEYWLSLCKASYYGGWFEIFSHGIIPGTSYNYDINNAYPYAIKHLPCMNPDHKHTFRRRKGADYAKKNGRFILVDARVTGSDDRVGPVPFRRKNGSILRPRIARGWYWLDELEASARAGLVGSFIVYEWAYFDPCPCGQPFTQIQDLYDLRLRVGKNTSKGKAIKLTNNSGYGKFAQNVGSAPYGNWFYASRITASCRMQILDAIASHPGGAESVLMVATDGICFDNPHPSLSISKKLGEWEESLYHDLTLFKPGVYWHRKGKDAVLDAKTRGVPKAALLECLDLADQQFQSWQAQKAFPGGLVNESISETLRVRTIFGWPYLDVPVSFRMTSCAQALNMGKWGEAGKVETDFYMRQDCDPHEKRFGQAWNPSKSRLDSFVHPVLDTERTTPYGAAEYPEIPDIGYGLDGPVMNTVAETLGALHETVEWTTVYDKG